MKKYLIYINTLIVSLLISCDDYLDVNIDPNNPTEVTPNLILPVAQNYTARYIQESRSTNHLGNMLMYNWSETYGFSWYPDEFGYLVTSSFYSDLFDDAYLLALKQYSILDQLGPEHDNYKAISTIMKSFHFQMLVDTYGDIPYFNALGRTANATPAYDDAQAIYDDLIVQLSEAISLIDAAEDNSLSVFPEDDDIMFGGDMAAWKRLANTIKLRILTRESDVASSAYISGELAVIAAEGSGYITEDVTINPGYAQEEGKQNPFWNSFGASVGGSVTLTNDATCATQYILDYLTNINDPRIDYIYEQPAGGHLGVEQGITVFQDHGADFVSNIGPGIKSGPNMDATILTLAESYFNQAELAFKGLGGDSESLYNSGVSASFVYLGAPGYSTYINQGMENVTYATSTDKLEAIITQKWIALNGITAIQSWFDYSRTGYPSNLPVSNQASTTDRPVRLFYPSSEVTGNILNVPEQPDAFNDKIFWAN